MTTNGPTKQLARIYSPPRSAMQSGKGRTGGWVLEFEPGEQVRRQARDDA